MAELVSYEGAIVAVIWAAVASRFVAVLRGGRIEKAGAYQREAWYLWASFFCIALAATARWQPVGELISAMLGTEFSKLPKSIIALAGFFVLLRVCYVIAPDVRPKRDWPLYLCLLAIAAYSALAAASSNSLVSIPMALLAGEALFHYVLLLLAVRFSIPAFAQLRQRERHPPMQLRLVFMQATSIGIAVWMLNDTMRDLMRVLELPYAYTLIYYPAQAATIGAYLVGYLMPLPYFRRLLTLRNYFSALITFVWIHLLEYQAAWWADQPMTRFSAGQALRNPADCIYWRTVSILDLRKVLKACADRRARALGKRLDWVADPSLEYEAVVERLRRISRERAGELWPLPGRDTLPVQTRGAELTSGVALRARDQRLSPEGSKTIHAMINHVRELEGLPKENAYDELSH